MAEWSRQNVVKACGVTHAEITEAVKNGDLTPLRGKGKSEVFESGDAQSFFGELAAKGDGSPELAAARELNKALGQALGHIKDLVRLVIEPRDVVLDMLRQENVSLRERAERSDEKMIDLITAFETLQDRKSERDLEAQRMHERAELRRETTRTLLDIAPAVIEQLASLHGLKLAVMSLSDQQMAFLEQSGLLTEEQLARLRAVRRPRKEQGKENGKRDERSDSGSEAGKAGSEAGGNSG